MFIVHHHISLFQYPLYKIYIYFLWGDLLSIVLWLIFQKRFINFSMNKRCLIIFWPTPIWMLSLVANIIQRLFEHISLNHLVIQVCKGASKQNNDCYVCEISQVTVVVLVFAAKFSFNHRMSYLCLK